MEWGDRELTNEILAWKFPLVWGKKFGERFVERFREKFGESFMEKLSVMWFCQCLWNNTWLRTIYEHEPACVIVTLFNIFGICGNIANKGSSRMGILGNPIAPNVHLIQS